MPFAEGGERLKCNTRYLTQGRRPVTLTVTMTLIAECTNRVQLTGHGDNRIIAPLRLHSGGADGPHRRRARTLQWWWEATEAYLSSCGGVVWDRVG